MRPAVAFDVNRAHRSQLLKIFQALAGRAFAQIQAFNECVHGERLLGDKKQTVDFGDGTGLAQRGGKLDEEVDDFNFARLNRLSLASGSAAGPALSVIISSCTGLF